MNSSADNVAVNACMNFQSSALAVSVVVPCRNEMSSILPSLRSILDQEVPQGDFEVIVVDGESDDGTAALLHDIASREPRLRVLLNSARTTACAFNVGIKQARGRYIALLGAHNIYAPDYLRQCLDVARQTGADNVGGSMIARGDQPLQRAIALAHHSRFACGGARWHDPDYEGEADTVFGGFYDRATLFRLGLFDEELLRNQDDELNLRLTRSGGRIWHSRRIRSWYQPRADLQALLQQYLQYGYWKVRVIQKHRLPASWRHLVPGLFVMALLGLPLLGLLDEAFLWLWFGIVALYATVTCAVAAALGQRHGWRLVPYLPSVFAAYHFGYGVGFIWGLVDFLVLGRRPANRMTVLTRERAR